MDSAALRKRVLDLRPKVPAEDQDKYMIVIVPHNISKIEDIQKESDLIWWRDTRDLTVGEVKLTYLSESTNKDDLKPNSVEFTAGDKKLTMDTTMSCLDFHKDKLIVLCASYFAPDMGNRPSKSEHEPLDAKVNSEQTSTFGDKPQSFMDVLRNVKDANKLEAIMKEVSSPLQDLENELRSDAAYSDLQIVAAQFAEAKKRAQKQRFLIGIFGCTGAGKSSLVNALLGEEQVVPTSCMRACTAVVTEVAYNDVDHRTYPNELYRAEIVPMTTEEAQKEVSSWFEDLLDEDGKLSRDYILSNTDAGVAHTKIKAVWPYLQKEDLITNSTSGLFNDQRVAAFLSGTKKVNSPTAKGLHNAIKRYVDTKLDATSTQDEDDGKGPEWWPLIKLVRIFVKATILSTGGVLVDLPGLRDANAARAAVAHSYMKQCSAVWIVASIDRAVDDEVAQKLLGSEFKRQLMFDGFLTSITFICTKTDDILIEDAARACGISSEIEEIDQRMDALETDVETAQTELAEVEAKIKECEPLVEAAVKEHTIWYERWTQHTGGRDVFDSQSTAEEKRNRPLRSQYSNNKRRKLTVDLDEPSDVSCDHKESESSDEMPIDDEINAAPKPLTAEELKTKTEQLKVLMRSARGDLKKLHDRQTTLKQQLKEADQACDELIEHRSAIAIRARNDWTRKHITQDFVTGIRELDDECIDIQGPQATLSSAMSRDYQELERSINVFTVSSRAYQQKSGHYKREAATLGFKTKRNTEIPQLREYCIRLTERDRTARCQAFLSAVSRGLQSMNVWLSDETRHRKRSLSERQKTEAIITRHISRLEQNLDVITANTTDQVQRIFKQTIQRCLNLAVLKATADTPTTARKWGQQMKAATYHATARRDGYFKNKKKLIFDFNQDLATPFERHILTGWDTAFSRKVPKQLKTHTESVGSALLTFHQDLMTKIGQDKASSAGAHMVHQKLADWHESSGHQVDDILSRMELLQRDANRQTLPNVEMGMFAAYDYCREQTGIGRFAREKDYMESHVQSQGGNIFRKCAKKLDDRLMSICTEAASDNDAFFTELLEEIRRDYMTAFVGFQVDDDEDTSAERERRAKLMEMVIGIEKQLKQKAKENE